jgi:hypothetical protein
MSEICGTYRKDEKREKDFSRKTRRYDLMFVDPCIIVQFIKKNPTRCNSVSKFLLFQIYIKLSMFRATHRPSSGPYNSTGSLLFFIRGGLLDV